MIKFNSFPRIICLSGWKGSGKDATAGILKDLFGYKRLAMADRLKDEVARIYNISRASLDDRATKEAPIMDMPIIAKDKFSAEIHKLLSAEIAHGYWTPRALCILEGSMRRAVDVNTWVKVVTQDILAEPNARFVITDMRYKSEAELFKATFGDDAQLWRIERANKIDTSDSSERDLDDYAGFDLRIKNTGTLDELSDSLSSFLIMDKK